MCALTTGCIGWGSGLLVLWRPGDFTGSSPTGATLEAVFSDRASEAAGDSPVALQDLLVGIVETAEPTFAEILSSLGITSKLAKAAASDLLGVPATLSNGRCESCGGRATVHVLSGRVINGVSEKMTRVELCDPCWCVHAGSKCKANGKRHTHQPPPGLAAGEGWLRRGRRRPPSTAGPRRSGAPGGRRGLD